MAKLRKATQTNAGSTQPISIDSSPYAFGLGFGVTVDSGTPSYTVEHTFELDESPVWFPHPTVATQTTNKDGNYQFPPTAIRLTVTGTGVATLRINSQ